MWAMLGRPSGYGCIPRRASAHMQWSRWWCVFRPSRAQNAAQFELGNGTGGKQQSNPPTDPAFLRLDWRRLIWTTLVRAMRTALTLSNHSSPHLVSLHRLRSGGAQASAQAGASLDAMRAVGRWRSRAVFECAAREVLSEAPQACYLDETLWCFWHGSSQGLVRFSWA